ncbi:DUF6583 family protein [Ornithinibacillus scapharcae]|uniref:DUF6583 family protein n=1 Tax=Ornithinibacillus scapharcae TaxID=1147159 RepID=UPI000225C04B|nr:DUF6583 family protein [Ornithinibacillus scapharcae]
MKMLLFLSRVVLFERGIQMEENNQEVKLKKKGFNKVLAIIIAAAVLLIGGSVAAFVLIDNNTPKASYFLSEKSTIEMLKGQFEDRYSSELDWSEKSLEKPIEDVYEFSAEVNIPFSGETGPITPEQIINNSTITVTSSLDRKEKIAAADIKGSFGNFSVEDINLYLTSEEMMVGLPFLNEVLQVKGDDFGSIMSQLDPMSFTGEEKIDFNMLFEGNVISKEDQKYLEDEYVKFIYDALPEEAFKSTDETVKIGSDNIKTEKITFKLTEKEIKDILADTLNKMAKDDKFKDILVKYVETQGTGPLVLGDNPIMPNLKEEFETAIDDMIEGLDDVVIPDGLTSTIWVEDDIIVKRDFSIEMGPSEDDLVTFYLDGELNNDKTNITFDYNLGVVEQDVDSFVTISGDLSNDDGKVNDKITLTVEDLELSYESTETTKDDKKDFDRTISFVDETGYTLNLLWTGNAKYDKDKMNSEHKFTVSADDIEEDAVILNVNKESKVIDSVTLPKEDEIKDLGSMTLDEMMIYFESVAPQVEEWLMGIVGFGY